MLHKHRIDEKLEGVTNTVMLKVQVSPGCMPTKEQFWDVIEEFSEMHSTIISGI